MQIEQQPGSNPAEDLLNKLAAGYGFPNGHATMPQGLGTTCKKLYHAILGADGPMLEEILHPDNQRSRKAFSSLSSTGALNLPRTVKGTKDLIYTFIEQLREGMNAKTSGAAA